MTGQLTVFAAAVEAQGSLSSTQMSLTPAAETLMFFSEPCGQQVPTWSTYICAIKHLRMMTWK